MLQYSFSLTTFSPSGKLVQIEYALNAVNGGSTSLGIKATNGVVIATEKKLRSTLIDESTVQKISLLTPNIGVAYSGMGPDSRLLVRKARKSAQVGSLWPCCILSISWCHRIWRSCNIHFTLYLMLQADCLKPSTKQSAQNDTYCASMMPSCASQRSTLGQLASAYSELGIWASKTSSVPGWYSAILC